MNLASIKEACVHVRAPAAQGTAYLVAPTRLATCHHVVESAGEGGEVELLLPEGVRSARVSKMDARTDCAILEVDDPLPGREPLPIGEGAGSRDLWDGYGFVELAKGSGLALFGTVVDPEAEDDLKRPMVTLYSEMLAAGMAAPVHGLSGGPVVTDGAVVGHFSRVLGTPGASGQPAFGLVYAARAANVAALLGATPGAPGVRTLAEPKVAGRDVTSLAKLIPRVGPGEFHAFISYRSSDRPFAEALYERLNAVGLRVFLDQRELVPGDQLARRLQTALGNSRCGIVLVSHGWLASPWCEEEGNAMVSRAVNERGGFRVIPVRIDHVEVPPFFAGRVWLDFAGESAPSGRKLDQLIYAVLGRPAPPEGSVEQKAQSTLTDATDKALSQVDEAMERVDDVVRDPTSFRSFLDFIRRRGLPDVALRLRAAKALIGAGGLEIALEILPRAEQSLGARQLRALALSKDRRDKEALALLQPLFEHGEIDVETGGILGGTYKRMWQRTNSRPYLIKSLDTYDVTYAATGDPYLGINVATMAFLLDKREQSQRAATGVRDRLRDRAEHELDHWNRATLAESYLLEGDLNGAAEWYEKAITLALNLPQDIAVMRRQARMILVKQGRDRNALDASLPVPPVVAFSGHMTDAPERPVARFPESKSETVRCELRRWLRDHGGRVQAVSSAARGADLLFIEEVLANEGAVTVLLPFPAADFKSVSVGQGWDDRFDAALANDRVNLRTLLEKTPPEGELERAFELCNLAIIDEADRLATLFDDDDPILLTVWNGNPGDASGGTAHAVSVWQQRGHPSANIDISKKM